MNEEKNQPHESCVCMTCGIRNYLGNPEGLCKNGHDAWITIKDVADRNTSFNKMLELTGMTAGYFTVLFIDPAIKSFPIQAELFKEDYGTY